jgi:DNA-binding LytR/AlgR family response regulator
MDMSEAARAKLTELQEELVSSDSDSVKTPHPADGHLPDWPVRSRGAASGAAGASGQRGLALLERRARLEQLPQIPAKIAIKSKGKILLISPTDILAIEAEGNYVLLLRRSESHLLRESISAMAEKLKPFHFVRIHRSVLVNAAVVEEIYPGDTGEYMLRITGGKEYVVSRTYKNNLKHLAQSWIGTDSFVDDKS